MKMEGQNNDEIKKKIEDILGKDFNALSEFQRKSFYYVHFPANCDSAILEKPDWLDIEKFKKGQRFAQDHLSALFLGQLYGLLCLLCHQDGLDILIMTQKSHTPYLAFKRYLATSQCIRHWYNEDPWCKDTQAYKDILKVRKMHLAASLQHFELTKKKGKTTDAIKNPYCPVFQSVFDDFSTMINMCCGSLEDIRKRCQKYIDEFVKPAFRRLSPQWEHMIRCIIEGNRYYFMIPTFEIVVLQTAELLDLRMPALYSSLTYFQKFQYYLNKFTHLPCFRFFNNFVMRFKFMKNLFNNLLNRALDKALNFDHIKMSELKIRSMNSPLHVSIDN
ncbi:hypothetical protein M0802_012116 [Mischocyttarus mexicanus]|nr:hypothetical protein M0802_012116 [Mischocyttarus mexicanus]